MTMISMGVALPDISLEFDDSQNYIIPLNNDKFMNRFEEEFTFCYESMLPMGSNMKAIQQKLVEDICDYFDLTISIEKRNIECYYMNDLGPLNIESKENADELPINEKVPDGFIFKGVAFESFLAGVAHIIGDTAVINGTRYRPEQKIDLELKFGGGGVRALNNQLRKYNLMLIKGTVVRDVAVVRKKQAEL